jgi:hypothetical protein
MAIAYRLSPLYVRKGGGYIVSLVGYLGQMAPDKRGDPEGLPGGMRRWSIFSSPRHPDQAEGLRPFSPRVDLTDAKERKTDGMSAYFLGPSPVLFMQLLFERRETYRKNVNLTMTKEVASGADTLRRESG